VKAPAENLTMTEEPAIRSGWRFAAWLSRGPDIASRAERQASVQAPWYEVMWLTGVDYFSSLAYQAGIAVVAAGMLSPVATGVLVLVTLCCAVPVYREVARRSYAGQGSIAMLEHLLSGWWADYFVACASAARAAGDNTSTWTPEAAALFR
jgi:hypothetical protein